MERPYSRFLFILSLRPLNLAMVAVSQILIYVFLIQPAFRVAGLTFQLPEPLFFQLTLVTVLIGLGGFLVNNLFDRETDRYNQKSFYVHIEPKRIWIMYAAVVIVGLALSLNIAYALDRLSLLVIYPVAVAALYIYARYFKAMGLPGNLLVAAFCGMVPAILLVADPALLSENHALVHQAGMLIISFSVFSFSANLIREIVKDIEDVGGDKASGLRTLPVRLGILRTKKVIAVLMVVFVLSLVAWVYWWWADLSFRGVGFTALFIISALVLGLFNLYKAAERQDFYRLSQLYKRIMIFGILDICLIANDLFHG